MGSFVHTAELPCADPNGRASRAVLSAGADVGQLRVTAPDDERLPAREAAGAYLRSAYRGVSRSPGSADGVCRSSASRMCLKKLRLRRFFLRRPFGLPTSQGSGGLGCMDSTLTPGHPEPFESEGARAAKGWTGTGASSSG